MKPLTNQDGMALLLVLVVVALLSALLTEFSFSTLVDLRATETFRDRTKAFYLARGGVDAARMILQEDQNNYDHPSEFWGELPSIPVEDGEVSLEILDLSGRLNLNEVANSAGQPGTVYSAFSELSKEVLAIGDTEANLLRSSIANWLNETRNSSDTLDDDNYYAQQQPPYLRKGGKLDSVDELLLLRDFDAEIVRKLRPYVRVHGDNLPLNLNTATAEVLYAYQYAAGAGQISLDLEACVEIVKYRRNTPLQTTNDLNSVPTVGTIWAGTWTAPIGFQGGVYQVSSTGRINQGTREAQAIYQKNGDNIVSLKVE